MFCLCTSVLFISRLIQRGITIILAQCNVELRYGSFQKGTEIRSPRSANVAVIPGVAAVHRHFRTDTK